MNAPREVERQLPHDLQAEKAVIGSVFILPPLMDDLMLSVRQDDFYNEANAVIWASMCRVYEKRQSVDVMLVASDLQKSKVLFERIGGFAYLAELAASVPTAANAAFYADIVSGHAQRRRTIAACTSGAQAAYDLGMDSGDALSLAESAVFGVRDDRGGNVREMADVMTELMAAFDERRAGGGVNIVPTGLRATDQSASLRSGELTILAGRPGMGKTALALNIAAGVAKQGRRVLMFSLEMCRLELTSRMLATASGVPLWCFRDNNLTENDIQRVMQANGEMSQWPLCIDDTGSHLVSDIRAICRREKRKRGLDLVVVDYLQLLEPERSTGRQNRAEEVAVMSRRLKVLARELESPVLVLCQLNREVEKGGDKRPRLHHLRESGSIEQDADNVLFVHREEYYLDDRQRADPAFAHTRGTAELIVAKQRNGETGTAKLLWHATTQRFSDPAPEAAANYTGYDEFKPAASQRDIF